MHLTELASALPRLGLRTALTTIGGRIWSGEHVYLGLRCDLGALPDVPPAQIPVAMASRSSRESVFKPELGRVRDGDYVQVLLRTWMEAADVRTLYVAETQDGRPIYAQWLIRRADQANLQRVTPGAHDVLREEEVLLEGAYTFSAFRGKGAMADGMRQLLVVARDDGKRSALTYVGAENVASLRGCARVGFELDHVRINTTRAGVRRSRRDGVTPAALAAWEAAASRQR